jgi:hypothetical protein
MTGIVEMKKIAANLGEGFIAIELGPLLAHKRMKQVQ